MNKRGGLVEKRKSFLPRMRKNCCIFYSPVTPKDSKKDSYSLMWDDYNGNLHACGRMGSLAMGRKIHGEAAKEGFENDPLVGRTLMEMYGKCGSFAEAREVFNELPAQNIVSCMDCTYCGIY